MYHLVYQIIYVVTDCLQSRHHQTTQKVPLQSAQFKQTPSIGESKAAAPSGGNDWSVGDWDTVENDWNDSSGNSLVLVCSRV